MSKAQSLIEQFYQQEQDRLAQEATFTPIDVNVSSADMAIINTIAKRFNQDKNQLVRDALSQALQDMFGALAPVERKMLAKEADELAQSIAAEIAEEQGLDKLEVTGTNWVQQDKLCIKEERKRQKELEKEQEAAASKVLASEPTGEAQPEESVLENTEDTASEPSTDDDSSLFASEEEPSNESSNSIFA